MFIMCLPNDALGVFKTVFPFFCFLFSFSNFLLLQKKKNHSCEHILLLEQLS